MGMGPEASFELLPGTVHAMSGMGGGPQWTWVRLSITFLMWWVMMVAMMLPSAAPTILLYAKAFGARSPETQTCATPAAPSSGSFMLGYLLAWGGFSLLATLLQVGLEALGLLDWMAMASRDRYLSAGLLFAAGLYQLSTLKQACLRHCRSPAQFLARYYRPGRAGAMRMGLRHGIYCVGCCWLLMALLFVGGVMNLVWIALLTVLVAGEKLVPFGAGLARFVGLAFLGWGAAIMILGGN